MTEKQTMRTERVRAEKALKKAIALEAVSHYCRTNGLSVEKLMRQRFEWLGDMAVFAQPSGVKPNGLMNDLETQPLPTLILCEKGGKMEIRETEHTKKFLAQ